MTNEQELQQMNEYLKQFAKKVNEVLSSMFREPTLKVVFELSGWGVGICSRSVDNLNQATAWAVSIGALSPINYVLDPSGKSVYC